jgi:predicted DNA-binding protein (MmcQ/YjbR family)
VLVAHASPYLKTRNWIQLCLMGEFTAELLDYVVAVLSEEIESLAKS